MKEIGHLYSNHHLCIVSADLFGSILFNKINLTIHICDSIRSSWRGLELSKKHWIAQNACFVVTLFMRHTW